MSKAALSRVCKPQQEGTDKVRSFAVEGRRERELQMHTVRRVLLRTDEKADEPSALMVQAMSKVEALLPHATPPLPARTLREETVREVLEACSVSYGVSSLG